MLSLLVWSPYYDEFANFIVRYAERTNLPRPIIVSQGMAQKQDVNSEVSMDTRYYRLTQLGNHYLHMLE
jgi:hypothetical protein